MRTRTAFRHGSAAAWLATGCMLLFTIMPVVHLATVAESHDSHNCPLCESFLRLRDVDRVETGPLLLPAAPTPESVCPLVAIGNAHPSALPLHPRAPPSA